MEPREDQSSTHQREDQPTVHEEDRMHSWPTLAGQLILDLTKVLEGEARLMRASIEPSLIAVLEHWLSQLIVASMAMLGSVLLLAALIILLHTWLAWWLSLAITGGATLLVAACVLLLR